MWSASAPGSPPAPCIRDGLRIGAIALVGLGAVVTSDVPDGTTVLGNPGRDLQTHRAMQAALKGLLRSQ